MMGKYSEDILHYWKRGFTNREIANKVGCNIGTALNTIKNAGLKSHPHKRKSGSPYRRKLFEIKEIANNAHIKNVQIAPERIMSVLNSPPDYRPLKGTMIEEVN